MWKIPLVNADRPVVAKPAKVGRRRTMKERDSQPESARISYATFWGLWAMWGISSSCGHTKRALSTTSYDCCQGQNRREATQNQLTTSQRTFVGALGARSRGFVRPRSLAGSATTGRSPHHQEPLTTQSSQFLRRSRVSGSTLVLLFTFPGKPIQQKRGHEPRLTRSEPGGDNLLGVLSRENVSDRRLTAASSTLWLHAFQQIPQAIAERLFFSVAEIPCATVPTLVQSISGSTSAISVCRGLRSSSAVICSPGLLICFNPLTRSPDDTCHSWFETRSNLRAQPGQRCQNCLPGYRGTCCELFQPCNCGLR